MDELGLTPERLMGRRVLIVGEVGAGKTRLTALALASFLSTYPGYEGTVIEMAPSGIQGLGTPLEAYMALPSTVRLLTARPIRAPRLEGRSGAEVLELARFNARRLRPLLLAYLRRPTPLLAINDLSLYLQAGSPGLMNRAIMSAETFLGNAYYGSSLDEDKGSGISLRERKAVEALLGLMDRIIRL